MDFHFECGSSDSLQGTKKKGGEPIFFNDADIRKVRVVYQDNGEWIVRGIFLTDEEGNNVFQFGDNGGRAAFVAPDSPLGSGEEVRNGMIEAPELNLLAGEKIVGVRGDIDYMWQCSYGFWRDLEFLVSDGNGNDRSHIFYNKGVDAAPRLPEDYMCPGDDECDFLAPSSLPASTAISSDMYQFPDGVPSYGNSLTGLRQTNGDTKFDFIFNCGESNSKHDADWNEGNSSVQEFEQGAVQKIDMIYQAASEWIVRGISMYGFDGTLLAQSGMNGAPSWEEGHVSSGSASLTLTQGERVVGIQGDIDYAWNGSFGYWRSVTWLISDAEDNVRAALMYTAPMNAPDRLNIS